MIFPSRGELLLSMLETAITAFEEQVAMVFHAHWQQNFFRIQGPTGHCASVGAPRSASLERKLLLAGGSRTGVRNSGFCVAPACLAPLADAWEALRDEAEALVAADPAARVAWGEADEPAYDGHEQADGDQGDRARLLDAKAYTGYIHTQWEVLQLNGRNDGSHDDETPPRRPAKAGELVSVIDIPSSL